MNATQIGTSRKEIQTQDAGREIAPAAGTSQTRKEQEVQPRRQAELRWWDYFRMSHA